MKHFGHNAFLKQNPEQIKQTFNHQARHHLLYQLSLLLNFIVNFVWWTYLHEGFVRKNKDIPVVGKGREFHLKSVHIIPLLVNLMNTLSLNCKL